MGAVGPRHYFSVSIGKRRGRCYILVARAYDTSHSPLGYSSLFMELPTIWRTRRTIGLCTLHIFANHSCAWTLRYHRHRRIAWIFYRHNHVRLVSSKKNMVKLFYCRYRIWYSTAFKIFAYSSYSHVWHSSAFVGMV